MPDELLRTLTSDGGLRLIAVDVTASVAEGVRRHRLGPVAALALARGLGAVALAAGIEKELFRLSVQFLARGPLGQIHVEARPSGALRGYVGEPRALPASLGEGLGAGGVVSVIRAQDDGRFVQGQSALGRRTIDGDLEHYLVQSEQVPSILRVLVDVDDAGLPRAVSGILAQVFPGAVDPVLPGDVLAPELLARTLPADLGVDALLARAAPGVAVDVLGRHALEFRCECSLERVARGVRMLGVEEIEQMERAGEAAEVGCSFCGTTWRLEGADLVAVLDELRASGGG